MKVLVDLGYGILRYGCSEFKKINTVTLFTLADISVDETGKKIRGRAEGDIGNYDNYVFDVWKHYYPQPIEIKHDSIYDYYDIHEEIGV